MTHIAFVGPQHHELMLACRLLALGVDVTLLEPDAANAERVRLRMDRMLPEQPAEEGGQFGRLVVSSDPQTVGTATHLIVGPHSSDIVEFMVEIAAIVSPDALLAVHAPVGRIDALAAICPKPANVVGLGIFGPGSEARLAEILLGSQSSEQAIQAWKQLCDMLGLISVTAASDRTFATDRLFARYHEAADTVFMDGSTPWEIDEAMVDFGFVMGPYEAQDLTGVDRALANRSEVFAQSRSPRRTIPIAGRMLELGKLGRSTGAGWYRYPGGGGKVDDPIVADLAIEESHFAGNARTDYAPVEIVDRLLLALINEAANLVHEGAVASAADADSISVHALGFPAALSGVLQHADAMGLDNVVSRLEALAMEDPVAWRISPLLADCAAKGVPLSGALDGADEKRQAARLIDK